MAEVAANLKLVCDKMLHAAAKRASVSRFIQPLLLVINYNIPVSRKVHRVKSRNST